MAGVSSVITRPNPDILNDVDLYREIKCSFHRLRMSANDKEKKKEWNHLHKCNDRFKSFIK